MCFTTRDTSANFFEHLGHLGIEVSEAQNEKFVGVQV